MNSPLISIIVPIYNVEVYLQHCIDSIVEQSYTNLEIILVNDGSPDKCPHICDEYAKKDNRISVIHKENGGLSDARNAGIRICRGDFIFFVDSDDSITKDCIMQLVSAAKDSAADVIIAQHRTNQVHTKALLLRKTESILEAYYKELFEPCAWNKLYRASFIKLHSLHFRKGLIFEDQLWCNQWIHKVKSILIIPNHTYNYNIRPGSITTSRNIALEKKINSWKIILQEMYSVSCTDNKYKLSTNLFILHRIEDSLQIASIGFSTFRTQYKCIQEILSVNPLFYWKHTANTPKKILFMILSIAPSYLTQLLLYFHIKKHAK